MKYIENLEFDGIDTSDYPDFSDAYISYAECNGVPLTEEELEDLSVHDYYDDLIQSMI